MLLGGLWHGAAWTFVVWGAVHGALLVAERAHGKAALWRRLPRQARVAVTFLLVTLAWVPFRAPDLPAAGRYLASLLGVRPEHAGAGLVGGVMHQPYYLLTVSLAALVVWAAPQSWDWTRRLSWARAGVLVGLFALALAALNTQEFNPFIYFIF
jgi:alginate O-acetyltransferase complex protein AlgI